VIDDAIGSFAMAYADQTVVDSAGESQGRQGGEAGDHEEDREGCVNVAKMPEFCSSAGAGPMLL
jgi:hypothetical protein